MTIERDPLDHAVRALRTRPPPPTRDGLEDDLLAAFDVARPRRPVLVRRVAAALAAAAVLVLAVRLSTAPGPARPDQPDRPTLSAEASALVAQLDARLDALQRDLDAAQLAPRAVAPPAPERVSGEELFAAHADRDPSLYRLAAARTYEESDPPAAARRYRELLALGEGGTAAAVARRRLAVLER